MLSRRLIVSLAALFLTIVPDREIRAAAFDVPGTHATLQAAVAAAAISADFNNTITLSVSPLMTGATVSIGGAFGPARHLLIRPAAPLIRASLVNTSPGAVIVDLAAAGYVVIQDLDILRNITNNNHLVVLSSCSNIIIERCRIGSNWTTPGGAGWSNIEMTYPTEVVLRNNNFFAMARGTFERGIHAYSFNDPSNSLWLYNNDVSDYKIYGIHLEGVIPGPLMVLRNNVVCNHPDLLPEPVAFRSNVAIGGPTVFTTHNTAFASAGSVQSAPAGNQDIAGLPAAALFLRFNKGVAVGAFLSKDWSMAPPWDFNPGFYHLVPGGALHIGPAEYGMTVPAAFPDVAVVDDIDKQGRPSGAGPHTDRGIDQIDPTTTAGVVAPEPGAGLLRVAARQNPARTLLLDYRAEAAGRLRLEVYDAQGQLLFRNERVVAAGAGAFEPSIAARGLVIYRLTLEVEGEPVASVAGKAVLLR